MKMKRKKRKRKKIRHDMGGDIECDTCVNCVFYVCQSVNQFFFCAGGFGKKIEMDFGDEFTGNKQEKAT